MLCLLNSVEHRKTFPNFYGSADTFEAEYPFEDNEYGVISTPFWSRRLIAGAIAARDRREAALANRAAKLAQLEDFLARAIADLHAREGPPDLILRVEK